MQTEEQYRRAAKKKKRTVTGRVTGIGSGNMEEVERTMFKNPVPRRCATCKKDLPVGKMIHAEQHHVFCDKKCGKGFGKKKRPKRKAAR